MSQVAIRITGFLLLALLLGCPGKQENRVVTFLTGAERQVETDAQKDELRRAFKELLSLPASQMRERRYANYQGEAGSWSAPQLIEKYYVPPKPMGLDSNEFYREAETPEARALFEKLLKDLN